MKSVLCVRNVLWGLGLQPTGPELDDPQDSAIARLPCFAIPGTMVQLMKSWIPHGDLLGVLHELCLARLEDVILRPRSPCDRSMFQAWSTYEQGNYILNRTQIVVYQVFSSFVLQQ